MVEIIPLFNSDEGTTSRDGKGDTSQLIYLVRGTDKRIIALTAVQSTAPDPNPTDNCALQKISLERVGRLHWIAKCDYSPLEPLDVGEFTWRFDGTGGTVHMTTPYDTTIYEAVSGDLPEDLAKCINVDLDRRVNGVDVPSPTMKLTLSYRLPRSVLTFAYVKQVGQLVGCYNDDSFLECDAGELLFLGPTGSAGTKQAPTIDFAFLYSENVTGLDLAGISVDKLGHDYIWPWFGKDVDAKTLIVKPLGFYVNQVCKEGDFKLLQLKNVPGGS